MFTGFASENIPAIQVWDYSIVGASIASPRYISLSDDCPPIHIFKTGGLNSSNQIIKVQLPNAYIEGKRLFIKNDKFGLSVNSIEIYSADAKDIGTSVPIYILWPGDFIELVYSKQAISFGSADGLYATGWLALNKSSAGAYNYNASVIGGQNLKANVPNSAVAGGSSNSTNGSNTFVGGGSGNNAGNTNAVVLGGLNNSVSGFYSAALASDTVSVSGTASAAIASGQPATLSGNNSAAIATTNFSVTNNKSAILGGSSNTVSGASSVVIGGASNAATSTYSFVVGGNGNSANSYLSIVAGGGYGTTRSIIGNFVAPASSTPLGFSAGIIQTAILLLGRQTTDATATVLTSDTSAASTTNQVILPNNSAYTFLGTVIANVTGGGNTSGWKFEGVIKRGATAASTTLVAAVTPTVIAQDAGAAAWVVSVTADTTNGGIKVTVTGAAATTIRWVCRIETTEVTF